MRLSLSMNYLAHLYLSGDSEQLLVGNFIGDYVKGNKYRSYSDEIAKGILLHRYIDSFTDQHIKHRAAKLYFKEEFGHYSGIIIDFIYDHFLAKKLAPVFRYFSEMVYKMVTFGFAFKLQGSPFTRARVPSFFDSTPTT